MLIQDIKVGQYIKFGVEVRGGIKNIKGEVFAVNTNHFTVQLKGYRESYQYKDIVTDVIVSKFKKLVDIIAVT